MTKIEKSFTALIPAAGTSGRMGKSKLFLEFKNGRCFLEEIIKQYQQFGCEQIIVVVNPPDLAIINSEPRRFMLPEIHYVENKFPEQGRFQSIQMGLKQLNNQQTVFMQNIDNPFVHQDVLINLAEVATSANWCVPVYNQQRGHPVCFGSDVQKAILNVSDRSTDVRVILKNFPVVEIPCNEPGILVNINSKDDYTRMF